MREKILPGSAPVVCALEPLKVYTDVVPPEKVPLFVKAPPIVMFEPVVATFALNIPDVIVRLFLTTKLRATAVAALSLRVTCLPAVLPALITKFHKGTVCVFIKNPLAPAIPEFVDTPSPITIVPPVMLFVAAVLIFTSTLPAVPEESGSIIVTVPPDILKLGLLVEGTSNELLPADKFFILILVVPTPPFSEIEIVPPAFLK